jgi:hypothetical protein
MNEPQYLSELPWNMFPKQQALAIEYLRKLMMEHHHREYGGYSFRCQLCDEVQDFIEEALATVAPRTTAAAQPAGGAK